MVFKNEKELERFIMKQSYQALMKAQDKVYKIINKWILEFYLDYTPTLYKRTFEIFSHLLKSNIVKDGKGYKAEVYFDLSGYYDTGSNPSFEQVFDVAAYDGLHGANGLHWETGNKGISIWEDPKREVDAKAIDILVNMLRAEGIPVKK